MEELNVIVKLNMSLAQLLKRMNDIKIKFCILLKQFKCVIIPFYIL